MKTFYYYLYYVIVEESAPENYMTYGATANPNIRPMSGDLNVAAWYVPWGVTETHVTDRYGTGTLKVTKVDGETEKALAGAVFTLDKTNAAGAWDTYLTKLEEEGLSDIQGCRDYRHGGWNPDLCDYRNRAEGEPATAPPSWASCPTAPIV